MARIGAILRRAGEVAAADVSTLQFADLTMNIDTHEVWRGRPSDRTDGDRVQPAALLAGERPAGDLEVRVARQRLGLRNPRRPQHRRDLHQLPAQEDRRHRSCSDPHHPPRRLHASGCPGKDEPPEAARRRRGVAAAASASSSPTSSRTPRSAPSSTARPTTHSPRTMGSGFNYSPSRRART